MMDLLILFITCLSFFIFLVIKIAILRYIGSTKIIKGLLYSFIIESFLHFMLFPVYFGFAVSFVSYIVFLLIAFIFIFALLGITITSLRIQILVAVSEAGKKGISYAKLVKTYNREIIVENRLERLLESGELGYRNGKYYYNDKISYFRFHIFLLQLLGRLYNVPNYQT